MRLQLCQCIPYLLHMTLDSDFRPDKSDVSPGIKKIGTANHPVVFPPGHFLQLPDAVLAQNIMARITEQGYPQFLFGNKIAMTFGGIRTDTDSHCVHLFKFVYQTGKPLGFPGSAGGVVLGIEEKNHPLPLKIDQVHVHIILIRQAENRCFICRLQHYRKSP